MAEISEGVKLKLADLFLVRFNADNGTTFILDKHGILRADTDFQAVSVLDSKELLRVQVVEAMSVRGPELTDIKKGVMRVFHRQSATLQVEEALGHKLSKYPTVDLQKDLVILILFNDFPWFPRELSGMKNRACTFKGSFRAVYCADINWHNACERLA